MKNWITVELSSEWSAFIEWPSSNEFLRVTIAIAVEALYAFIGHNAHETRGSLGFACGVRVQKEIGE